VTKTFQNGYRNHDGDCKTLWGHPELCNRYGLIQIFKFVQRKLHWVSTTSSQIHTLIKEAWTYNVQSNLYTKGTHGNLKMCLYVQLYNFNGGEDCVVRFVLDQHTYSEILFWLRATKSVLTPLYYVLRREEIFYNFIVFGLTRSVLESMIYFTRRNMINAVTFFSFEVDGTYCSAAK
jgi:hypothetical protein